MNDERWLSVDDDGLERQPNAVGLAAFVSQTEQEFGGINLGLGKVTQVPDQTDNDD